MTPEETLFTSPWIFAILASSTTVRIASHAHRTLALGHGSGSNFFRGAYIVGQKVVLCFSAIWVNAALRGTSTTYGVARLYSAGGCGGKGVSETVDSSKVVVWAVFRIRLRCVSVGVSYPTCFSHLCAPG